jgi:hypothetical protein
MAEVAAVTQVLIYRLDADPVTAVGRGSLVDPQVVALHEGAIDQLATKLRNAAAEVGPAARLRVRVISDGSELVTDGTLGTSAAAYGPPIAVVGLDVASSAPVAPVDGLAPWDDFVLPPDAESGDDPVRPAGTEADLDRIAASIRALVATASAAEAPIVEVDTGPGRPTTPADLVGAPLVGQLDPAAAPAVALAHRTVSPLCRLFPWLPFC